ncbi:MAG: transcription termination factor NusA [Erysipelotrichaceae bacterium]|nr:transcription termination factor NusA [Erysipelotrichaceae bacterium]
MLKALALVEDEKNISEEVILDALKEAMAKAYKKNAELQDIDVVAEINEKKKTIDLYQNYTVVASDDDVEDDELEIGLAEAKAYDANAEVGGIIRRPVEMTEMSRAAVSIAKNVLRQKIREAEKVSVYNEYIDKKDDMVLGEVESVKDKFVLVNLGKATALMPRSAQIPNERLREGQQIRVVIKEVNKETKGSQVLVSRADPMLVKRLFEKEVPEIYDGTVEIKAIAREVGDRTKMAVISHNPDVDPIGACIGPKGQRVQRIIEELKGEKIDIFTYSDDLTELVKNALAPASVIAVIPQSDAHNLLVIVEEDQLSLAIGKRGKNARLAVKLINRNIDIKTRRDIEDMGMDYDALIEEAEARREEIRRENLRRENQRKIEEAKAKAEERIAEGHRKLEALGGKAEAEDDDFIPDEMMEGLDDRVYESIDLSTNEEGKEEEPVIQEIEEVIETEEEPAVEVVEEETEEDTEEVFEETMEKKPESRKHANLEEMAANNTYVSRFEKLADTSKPKQDTKFRKKNRKKDEESPYKVSNKELEKALKDKLAANKAAAKPIYTEEELAEIEAQQEAEEEREYDIDYDEYEDFYDEDDN